MTPKQKIFKIIFKLSSLLRFFSNTIMLIPAGFDIRIFVLFISQVNQKQLVYRGGEFAFQPEWNQSATMRGAILCCGYVSSVCANSLCVCAFWAVEKMKRRRASTSHRCRFEQTQKGHARVRFYGEYLGMQNPSLH